MDENRSDLLKSLFEVDEPSAEINKNYGNYYRLRF